MWEAKKSLHFCEVQGAAKPKAATTKHLPASHQSSHVTPTSFHKEVCLWGKVQRPALLEGELLGGSTIISSEQVTSFEHLRDRPKVPLAEWFLCWMDCTDTTSSRKWGYIVGMGFGWLVCVDWLLGERGTFIFKVQPTIKCREKQSLIFTLYLSEEPLCTNTIIFMTSLAGISNLHSCCCLLTFSLYKHFLPFIHFLLDNGWASHHALSCTHHPHHCAAKPGRTSADPKLKSLMLCLWCLSMSLWLLGAAALQQDGSHTPWILGRKEFCGLSVTMSWGLDLLFFYSKEYFFPVSY